MKDELTNPNEDEAKILTHIKRKKKSTIQDMAELFGKITAKSKPKLTSRVRNALRRPVAYALIHQTGKGTYEIGAGSGKKFAKTKKAKTKKLAKKLAKKMRKAKAARAPQKAGKVAREKQPRAEQRKLSVVETSEAKTENAINPAFAVEVKTHFPKLEPDTDDFNTACIFFAKAELGESTTKIAAATGLSRGFVIRRLQKHGAAVDTKMAGDELVAQIGKLFVKDAA